MECSFSFNTLTAGAVYLFSTINIISCSFAFFGNALVLIVILKTKEMRTRSNIILASLAITDFAVGIIVQPVIILQLLSRVMQANCSLVLIRRFFTVFITGASLGSVALVSFDRYVHLTRLNNYSQFMTKRKVTILIVITWMVPFTMPFLRYATTNGRAYNVVLTLYLLATAAVMIGCYTFVVRLLQEKRRKIASHISQAELRNVKHHVKGAKTAIIIAALSTVCLVPLTFYLLLAIIQSYSPSSVEFMAEKGDVIYAIAATFLMMNSGINPVIYYWRNHEIRSKINGLFRTS